MSRTVLVTGAAGQLARELLAARRFPADVAVVGLDRRELDLRDAAAVQRVIAGRRPAVVINAAAWTAVDRAEAEPAAAFAVNDVGVRHLAAACSAAGIPLLQVSTDYVFDGSRATAWRECDTPSPVSAYGASKLAGERAARTCPQHLVLRTSWLFGAHGPNFVRTMLRLAQVRGELRVVADQRGCPTWAGDLARELATLAVRHLDGDALDWGVWHYRGAPATTWHGFAQEIVAAACAAGLLARPVPVRPIATADFPVPARRPANGVLDMAASGAALGLVPADWRVGLRRVLADWRRDGVRFDR